MLKILFILLIFFIFLNSKSFSEVNDKQKKVIENQLFLLHEGMITPGDVFKKAKIFDTTGLLGIGADRMKEREFNKYLENKLKNLEN
jgi:hypothetical protein